MVYSKIYPRYRRAGRFFGRRVNCEYVPPLPARVVGGMLDDPRRIPYLLVWRDRQDWAVKEAVRISPRIEPPVPFPADWTDVIEIKRPSGTRNFISTVLSSPSGNGSKARLLVCSYCSMPRRALYGWVPGGQYTTSVNRSDWQCRACAGLRYASEGGALVFRSRGSFFRAIEMAHGNPRSPRPESRLPEIYVCGPVRSSTERSLAAAMEYLIVRRSQADSGQKSSIKPKLT